MELDGDLGTLVVHGLDEVREPGAEAVVVDPHGVSDSAAEHPVDRRVLGDDQADAATGAGAEVLDQSLIHRSPGGGELGEDRRLY
jgi:hypothetical protein